MKSQEHGKNFVKYVHGVLDDFGIKYDSRILKGVGKPKNIANKLFEEIQRFVDYDNNNFLTCVCSNNKKLHVVRAPADYYVRSGLIKCALEEIDENKGNFDIDNRTEQNIDFGISKQRVIGEFELMIFEKISSIKYKPAIIASYEDFDDKNKTVFMY
jgi:hypothetical protein